MELQTFNATCGPHPFFLQFWRLNLGSPLCPAPPAVWKAEDTGLSDGHSCLGWEWSIQNSLSAKLEGFISENKTIFITK